MSALSAWLLSIACVIVICVLIELVLPEGQINKYIKVVMSFFVILVIISPLPSLLGSDFDISKYFSGTTELQEDYLYQINIDKLNALSADISDDISDLGLKNVVVSIDADVFCETLKINSVFVDLCDLEYDEIFENKNETSAKAAIKDIISNYIADVEIEFSG